MGQEPLVDITVPGNSRPRFSNGLMDRYGPAKPPPELGSTSLNDSEQMANDLNVADWDNSGDADWRPEGETSDDWRPKDSPTRAPGGGHFGASSSVDAETGLFSKPPAPRERERELVQVNYLTDAILAQHTQAQSFEVRMNQWRDGAASRGERLMNVAQGANDGQGWNKKMAGLHGEDQAPEDDAERAAQGRVLFRPVAGAAALPSGRIGRNGGGLFQSARRAISIRRDLSMRSHGQHRLRPQTVRVSAPLKPAAPSTSPGPQTKAEREEAARETEKLAREAARRAARRAAARAAALNAAKQAEEDAARAAREAEQEQADADAQRIAQVARRAAVAREAAQAARRKRQPVFNIDEKDPGARRVRGQKAQGTGGLTSQPSSRPTSQRTNTQSPRTQRSVTAALSEKGSTRSSPGTGARRKKGAGYQVVGTSLRSQSHRVSSPLLSKSHHQQHLSRSLVSGGKTPAQPSSNATNTSNSSEGSSQPPNSLPTALTIPSLTPAPPLISPPVTAALTPPSASTHTHYSANAPAMPAPTPVSGKALVSPPSVLLATTSIATGDNKSVHERVYLPAQRPAAAKGSASQHVDSGGSGGGAQPAGKTAKTGGRKHANGLGGVPSSPIAAS